MDDDRNIYQQFGFQDHDDMLITQRGLADDPEYDEEEDEDLLDESILEKYAKEKHKKV